MQPGADSSVPTYHEPSMLVPDSRDSDDLDVSSELVTTLIDDNAVSESLARGKDVSSSSQTKQKGSLIEAINVDSSVQNTDNANSPQSKSAQAQRQRARTATLRSGSHMSSRDPTGDTKDLDAVDWHVEGPGRRVGYDDLTAIDWIFEYAKERQRLRVLLSNTKGLWGHAYRFADDSQIWIVLIATGIAVGAIAAGIDVVSDWLGDLKTGYCGNVAAGGRFYLNKYFCCWGLDDIEICKDWRSWSTVMGVFSSGGSWVIDFIYYAVYSASFATMASFLVATYSYYAKQSGIPEIKTVLGGYVMKQFLGSWTLVVKSLGLCLAVSSGLWLGKEGPLVHVACCCANLFIKFFDNINGNEARKREVLSAAAASGISVAFGSPVGGVLFSLEQLAYYFPDKTMWQSFVCAMVAAFTLQAFNPFRTGKLVLYQVTYNSTWHAFEILPFVLIGILGGLYGGLFIKLNMRIARMRSSANYPFRERPVLEVALVALVTALISFPITFLRAQSSELVSYLLAECSDIAMDPLGLCKSGIANTGVIFLLLVSAVIGFFLAAVTFGLQIPAGILLPSMALGALYGRVIGLVVEIWQTRHPGFIAFRACEPDVACITPGTYAIIGAASALAGATRMTVSIVVIMFELTGALTYVLPIMIAVMIAKWVGDAITRRGIYESWIHFNSYPLLDNRDDRPVPDATVNQIMTCVDDMSLITATGHTVSSLKSLLAKTRYRGFPIVNSTTDLLLLGYISRTELSYALESSMAGADAKPSTPCYFIHHVPAQRSVSPTHITADSEQATNTSTPPRKSELDLRPWMDQTPITLSSSARLQLTVNIFQRMGLRYILFADKGRLAGLLTKKDVWHVLNEGDIEMETRGHAMGSAGVEAMQRQDVDESEGLHSAAGRRLEPEQRGLLDHE